MNALVTINFNEALGANSRASMVAACGRWGCEFVEVKPPWSETNANHPVHSPASMKTLLFSEIASQFDRVMWLDADTVVRSDTPSPFDTFARGSLAVVENGGVRFGDQAQIRSAEQFEWGKVKAHMLKSSGMESAPDARQVIPYFNTGMMVADAGLKRIFLCAEKICRKDLGLGWCDQTPINFAAAVFEAFRIVNGTPAEPVVRLVNEEWNYIHPECCLGPDWRNMKKYIYHFAGTCGRRELMEQVVWRL